MRFAKVASDSHEERRCWLYVDRLPAMDQITEVPSHQNPPTDTFEPKSELDT